MRFSSLKFFNLYFRQGHARQPLLAFQDNGFVGKEVGAVKADGVAFGDTWCVLSSCGRTSVTPLLRFFELIAPESCDLRRFQSRYHDDHNHPQSSFVNYP
jgi:hypothetical protein